METGDGDILVAEDEGDAGDEEGEEEGGQLGPVPFPQLYYPQVC